MEFKASQEPQSELQNDKVMGVRSVDEAGILSNSQVPLAENQDNQQATNNISRIIELVTMIRGRLESPPESIPTVSLIAGLSMRLRNGAWCDEVIQEVKQIKQMSAERGMAVAEIKKLHPNFNVWSVMDLLPDEDRQTFAHPNQWGPTVGYARKLLARYYQKSESTIGDWVKDYRSQSKRKN
jgi:hypothetical protein